MAGEFEEIRVYLKDGLNTSVDRSTINSGNLVEADGLEFRPPRLGLFGVEGRSKSDSGLSATGASDDGIYRLIAMPGYRETAGPYRLYAMARQSGASAIHFQGTADSNDIVQFQPWSPGDNTVTETWTSSATAAGAVHYDGGWYLWNGLERQVMWDSGAINNIFAMHIGDVTASGVAQASGSGSSLAAGTYEAWFTKQTDSTTFFFDRGISEGTYTPGASQVTLSASGIKIALTLPSTMPKSDGSRGGIHFYLTQPGGVFPNGYKYEVSAFATADSTYYITSLDTGIPFDIVSPLGGVPVGQKHAPPIIYHAVVYNNSIVAIDAENRLTIRYSMPGFPNQFPVINVIPFDSGSGDELTSLIELDGLLLVFSSYEVYRMTRLPRHTDPDDLTNAQAKIKKKFIHGHGAISSRGVVTINTPRTGNICLFVCRDGIHATNGAQMWYVTKSIDWSALVDISQLHLCQLVDNPRRHRIQFYYVDNSDNYQRLDLYYYDELIQESGLPAILGPTPVPGLTSTVAPGTNDWDEWSAHATSKIVYREGTGTTDDALLVDSNGTINKRWKTKDFYFGGINRDFELERVYVHQSQTTASGSYTVTGAFRTDDSTPFTAVGTVDQTLQNAQPINFINDRAQSLSLRGAKDDTGDLQELDYIVFVVKSGTELASEKSNV